MVCPGGWRRGSSSSCSAGCRAAARTGWTGRRRTTMETSRVRSWGVVCTLCTVSPTLAAWFLLAQGRYGVPDVSTALTSPNVTSTSDTCFSFWFQIKVRLPVSGSPPVSPRMRRRAAAWTSSPSSCGRAARTACCGTTRPSWTTGRRARPCCPKMTISRCV